MILFLRRLCVFLSCAAAVWVGGCSQIVSATNNYRVNSAWAASQQARILVAGTITDPEGHPLREVRVTYHYTYLSPTVQDLPRARTIHQTRTEPAKGKFRFVISYAEEAHFHFTKPGYKEVTLDFHVTPQPGGDDSLARYPKAAEIIQDNLKIVMQPVTPTPATSR